MDSFPLYRIFYSFVLVFFISACSAQGRTLQVQGQTDMAMEVENIMKHALGLISGPKSKKRDFSSFRSLFTKGATISTEYENKELAITESNSLSVEQFIEQNRAFYQKNDFWEIPLQHHIIKQEKDRVVADQLYEIYLSNPNEAKPVVTGINRYELIHDGESWKVKEIFYRAYPSKDDLPAYFRQDSFSKCNQFNLEVEEFHELSYTDHPELDYLAPVLKGNDKHTRRVVQKNYKIPRSFLTNTNKATIEMLVQFVVTEDAEVRDVELVSSSNNESLDQEAIRAISELQFKKPAVLKGQEVSMCYHMPIRIVIR